MTQIAERIFECRDYYLTMLGLRKQKEGNLHSRILFKFEYYAYVLCVCVFMCIPNRMCMEMYM